MPYVRVFLPEGFKVEILKAFVHLAFGARQVIISHIQIGQQKRLNNLLAVQIINIIKIKD